MAQKCVSCGAPIEGFFAKISALAGVKQSAKNPDYCNKCENKIPRESTPVAAEKPEEPKDIYEAAAEPVPEKQEEIIRTDIPAEAAPSEEKKPEAPKPEEKLVLNQEEPEDLFDAEEKKQQ